MDSIWPILLNAAAVIVPALATAAVAWLRAYAQRLAAQGAASRAEATNAPDKEQAIRDELSQLPRAVRPLEGTARRLASQEAARAPSVTVAPSEPRQEIP